MRLTRIGSKKNPKYRVIVADSRAPRDGRHVDIVGSYDPVTQPATVNIDTERAVKWLRNGAQPSDRVRILLRHSGVLKAHEEARLADKRARKEQGGQAGGPATAAGKAVVSAVAGAAGAVADTASTVVDAAGAVADTAGKVARRATKAAGSVVEAVTEALPGAGSDSEDK